MSVSERGTIRTVGALRRWALGAFVGLLSAMLLTAPGYAQRGEREAELAYSFRYLSHEVDGESGHLIQIVVTIPENTSVGALNVVFHEVSEYLLFIRESTYTTEPNLLAEALDLSPDAVDAQFASDLRAVSFDSLLLSVVRAFIAISDQSLLAFPAATTLEYSQFVPLGGLREGAGPKGESEIEGMARSTMEDAAADGAASKLGSGGGGGGRGVADEDASPMMNFHSREFDAQGLREVSPDALDALPDPVMEQTFRDYVDWIAQTSHVNPDLQLKMIRANLIASLLSYRSELGELPATLAELQEAGHLIVHLRDPLTGHDFLPQSVNAPGGIYYERTAVNVGLVIVNETTGRKRRDMIETPPPRPNVTRHGILGEGIDDYSSEEMQVRRTVFQIAKLLELFKNEEGYYPSSVSQLALFQFAHLSFPNPYAPGRWAQPTSHRLQAPGDYYYNRITPTEFILIGYGPNGPVLSLQPSLVGR